MKKNILLLVTCLPIAACIGPEKIIVTNVHDLAALPPDSYIYSVPRNRIMINISAVRHYSVPGPYHEYAEELLSIQGAPSLSATDWEICSIDVMPVNEPDPEYYFSIQAGSSSSVPGKLLELTSSGLVMKPDEFNPFLDYSTGYDDLPEPLHFTDLSVKRNFEDETSVKPESKGSLSVPIDMPMIKHTDEFKSTEQKAVEAANFIVKIRKRRFKLLAGQYEVFPEEQALETSVREMNALEKEYLSLFIGKVYSDTLHRTYFYTPVSGKEIEQNVFCRFSDETGFYDPMSASGQPLILELKNLQFTEGLKQLQFPYAGPRYENMILYRIPDNASIRIFYGSSIILEAEMKIFQYGVFVPYHLQVK